jgi:hypothetical protein
MGTQIKQDARDGQMRAASATHHPALNKEFSENFSVPPALRQDRLDA